MIFRYLDMEIILDIFDMVHSSFPSFPAFFPRADPRRDPHLIHPDAEPQRGAPRLGAGGQVEAVEALRLAELEQVVGGQVLTIGKPWENHGKSMGKALDM